MKKIFQKLFYQTQQNSIFSIVIVIIAIVSLIAIFFAFNQVSYEQQRLANDIQDRSSLLADGLKESVEPNFINKSDTYLQDVVERFANRKRIAGLGVVDNNGNIIAATSSLPQTLLQSQHIITDAMDSDTENGDFETYKGIKYYIFATPLEDKKSVVGALVIVQNANYINNRLNQIWESTFLRLLAQIFLLSIVVLLALRWIFLKPIQTLVTSVQDVRLNKNKKQTEKITAHPLFQPLLQEVSSMQKSLIKARLAVTEEAKLSLEKLDSPWTEERLKQFTKDILKNRLLTAVSNLEPYIHTKNGNRISYHVPASGLITAIEPVMQACGGVWVAQGIGNADKLVVDKNSTIQVPPEEPKYTVKRVWLTQEEEQGYSYGCADQALYPLFHMSHMRPVFREDDWEQYKKVNDKFAHTVLAEIKNLQKPLIFIQDFHFTLLSRIIKGQRPDATIGIFWHIPWVSAEVFSICPWKKEIIDGMLGADLIGFHTQLYCNNFIETVGRELESLIDYEQFTVTRNGHISLIKSFPISIAFADEQQEMKKDIREQSEIKTLLKSLGVHTKYIGIGVDRLDYIKGITERFTGIEIFLEMYPEYREKFTFIQISSPSETKSGKYLAFVQNVEKEVARINNRFKTKNWQPIIFLPKHHSHQELNWYYKLADVCLITSLHDGMNLVAKEFVAARNDEKGVLILSQFAGAAKELKDALLINPYNGKQTAQVMYAALTMPLQEQNKRMKKLRSVVRNYNIYRWSAEFLKTLVSLE